MTTTSTQGLTPEATAPHSPEEAGQPALRVLALLSRQADLSAKLEALSERQRGLVSADDVGSLLSLLGRRRLLSDELAQVASRLQPVRRAWSHYRRRLTPEQSADAERWLGEARDRLGRIMARDGEDARVLSGRKAAVGRALRSAHAAGEALSAYRAPAAGASRLDCVDGDSS